MSFSFVFSLIIFFGSLGGLVFLIISKVKNKKKVKNKSENKKNNSSQSDVVKPEKRTTDLLPFGAYDIEEDCYINKDGIYMDLVKIVSKDLENMSDDELEYDNMKFLKLHKTYYEDVKFISLNFPCNTTTQQEYWNKKIEKNKNQIYNYWLNKNLTECQYIEKNFSSKEFYIMVFCESFEDHQKKLNQIKNILGCGMDGLMEYLPPEKKHQLMFKFNNKNSLMI